MKSFVLPSLAAAAGTIVATLSLGSAVLRRPPSIERSDAVVMILDAAEPASSGPFIALNSLVIVLLLLSGGGAALLFLGELMKPKAIRRTPNDRRPASSRRTPVPPTARR